MPARQRSSRLWRSSDPEAELRSRSSATTGPKKTACARATRRNRAQSYTSGKRPQNILPFSVQHICVFHSPFKSFSRIINKHTDESLGDCSFLNTCFHMDTCKYVHYEIDSPPETEGNLLGPQAGTTELGLHTGDADSNVGKLFPSQVRRREKILSR